MQPSRLVTSLRPADCDRKTQLSESTSKCPRLRSGYLIFFSPNRWPQRIGSSSDAQVHCRQTAVREPSKMDARDLPARLFRSAKKCRYSRIFVYEGADPLS